MLDNAVLRMTLSSSNAEIWVKLPCIFIGWKTGRCKNSVAGIYI